MMSIHGLSTAIGVAFLGVLAVAACGGPDLSADQLAWCEGHQGQVGRVALSRGLLHPGQAYTDWKTGDPGGYRTSCTEAFGSR
jgi:hypothetical protein